VALAAAGLALIGAGVAGQESVPELSATPPGVSASPASGGSGTSGLTSSLPGGTRSGPVLPAAEPVRLAVPAVGIDAAGLVSLGLQPDGALEVPGDGDVAGWYRHGPTPGELGPAVLAGHVDSAVTGPAVFFRLAEVRPGDEIRLDRADGTVAVFRVDRVAQYPKDRFPTAEVYGDTDHAALRLITCGGTFDASARSYRDNIVVFARLTGTG
jgi:hypothetical protein